MYHQPFFITTDISNNSFSFSKRKTPSIHVAKLLDGSLEDVTIGDETVFEEYNENNILISCKGLKNFIRTEKNLNLNKKIPIYIFDNHNHAFAFWHLEWQKKRVKPSATLIHIDQHRDNRIPTVYLDANKAKDPNDVFTYTNTILNVGNFIPPAQKTGLLKEVIMIDSEYTMENFLYHKDDSDLILDIDLDFFSSDMDYIDHNKKVLFIQKLLPYAATITVATSPYFIEQDKAIYWLKKIFQSVA